MNILKSYEQLPDYEEIPNSVDDSKNLLVSAFEAFELSCFIRSFTFFFSIFVYLYPRTNPILPLILQLLLDKFALVVAYLFGVVSFVQILIKRGVITQLHLHVHVQGQTHLLVLPVIVDSCKRAMVILYG